MIDLYLDDFRYVIHYYGEKNVLSNRYGSKGVRFMNSVALIIYGNTLYVDQGTAAFYETTLLEFYEQYLDNL